jgi:Bacterial extracellular solute-binding protein
MSSFLPKELHQSGPEAEVDTLVCGADLAPREIARSDNVEGRTQRMKDRILATAAVLFMAGATAQAQERTLTISVYAFAQDAYAKIVYQPFEKECGCKLVVETGNSAERLTKMEVNKAEPVIDMAVMSMADALSAARQGLVDKIDTSKLSNFVRLYDIAKDPNQDGMSVGYTFYATSIAYRSDKVKITSWNDLLSKQLAGRVALPNITESGSAGALHARAGDGQGYARPQGVHRRRWRASQRHRHLLQSVVATCSTYGAGRDLGCADRAVRVGAATQARCSDQVGDAQRRPDGRPQRHGRHQGVEES